MVVQVMPVYNCSVTPIQSSWGQKKKKQTGKTTQNQGGKTRLGQHYQQKTQEVKLTR